MRTPPKVLRAELERHRERGRPFRIAWPAAVSRATSDLPPSEAVWWRQVFNEQRRVWLLSYSRQPWPASGRLPAFVVPDRETRPSTRDLLVA